MAEIEMLFVIAVIWLFWLLSIVVGTLLGAVPLWEALLVFSPLFVLVVGIAGGPRGRDYDFPPRQWIDGYGHSKYPRDNYGRIIGPRDRY
jgi:hypothetical protein